MLLAAPLIDLPAAYRLMSAMPTGLNAMVVSHAYGLDNRDRRRGGHLVDRDRDRRCPTLAGVLMLQHVGIEIAPADVDRAVEFFTLLGFEQVEPPPALADGFTWVERDGTQVHLMHEEQPDGAAARPPRRGRRPTSRRPSPACTSTASRPDPAASTGAPRAPTPSPPAATASS